MDGAVKFNYVFQRVEVKYMLDSAQHSAFMTGIEPYMAADAYGLSTISNIYYDTENYELVRSSIEKPVFKEKLRLRTYGTAKMDSPVFLEIKRKYKETVYKRRVSMTLAEAEDYLTRGIYPAARDCQIMREIDYFMKLYRPIARVYLAYDRTAYFGREDSQLRMTLDSGIRSRLDNLSLAYGDGGEALIDGRDYHLLEIKAPDAMPVWLTSLLSKNKIYPTSFSKYGAVYKDRIRYSVSPSAIPQTESEYDIINEGELINVQQRT
ncbi:MAG: polyphosphate polymerase domain-containing protein [Eubacteriales bacterium]